MRRIFLSFLLVVAVAGPVVTGVATARAADATVTFTDRANPATLTVTPGTRVTFANRSGERKRVRSDDGPAEFDSGNVESGGSWSVVLDAAGTYAYVDERDRDNSAFHGTITVTPSTQPAAGPPDAPAPGASSGSPASTAPATASVAILDRSFSPLSITVAPGGTVTWTNQSGRDHTATGTGFDSGVLGEGGRYSQIFRTAGTFSYICDIHPEMRGSVTVAASTGGPPSAAPPAPAPPPPAPAGAPVAPRPQSSPPQTPAPAGAAAAVRHEVAVVDYAFRPAAVSARVGDSVVWINQGRAPHTATAGGAFDTNLFRAGEQRTTVVRTAGTFAFSCTVHPDMTGVLTVAPAADGTASGAASPRSATPSGSSADLRGTTTATSPAPDPAEGTAAAAPPVEVSVEDFAFAPGSVRVSVGGTVTWRQNGRAPHTVSAVDSSFESGLLESGGSFTHRFDEIGTYEYVCAFHPQMTATIEVVDGQAAATTGEGADEGAAGAGGTEKAAASFGTDAGDDGGLSGGALLAALLGGALLLAGCGAFLYGGSRMVAAGERS
jgi:plastocyanin